MAEVRVTNGLIKNDIQEEIRKYERKEISSVPLYVEDEVGFRAIVRIYDDALVKQVKKARLTEGSYVNLDVVTGSFFGLNNERYQYYRLLRIQRFESEWSMMRAINSNYCVG